MILSKKIRNIHITRIAAVQALYAFAIKKSDVNRIIIDAIEYSKIFLLEENDFVIDQKYLTNLIKGTTQNIQYLDISIQQYLDISWRFERLALVMQAILRVAVYEILFNKDLDKAIIMDEYIEITKIFRHDGEAGFINSVLDNITKNI